MGRIPMKILFVYEYKYPEDWKDGLSGALKVISKEYKHKVVKFNLAKRKKIKLRGVDFVLGWGAFGSKVHHVTKSLAVKKGLCIAGNAIAPYDSESYDVFFYETDWYKEALGNVNKVKAFGINTEIYNTANRPEKYLWDYLTVGAFSNWKRQYLLAEKKGNKFAIGEIQEDNPTESGDILAYLIANGVGVSNMVAPEYLADYYRHSEVVYIPADINGGGERAVLEARACGCKVEVEPDNPKLKELVEMENIPTHKDYAKSLIKGIESCL